MRRAVDTNILVRLLAKDDSRQWKQASGLLEADTIVVPATVLLETEWVLRSAFGYDRAVVSLLFAGLLGLPNVEFVEEERVVTAVSLHKEGMDFADALHLTGADGCDEFVTFDKDLTKLARKFASDVPVKLL